MHGSALQVHLNEDSIAPSFLSSKGQWLNIVLMQRITWFPFHSCAIYLSLSLLTEQLHRLIMPQNHCNNVSLELVGLLSVNLLFGIWFTIQSTATFSCTQVPCYCLFDSAQRELHHLSCCDSISGPKFQRKLQVISVCSCIWPPVSSLVFQINFGLVSWGLPAE